MILRFLLATLICLLSFTLKAEDFDDHQDFEKYSVYYSILASTFVPKEVAAAYGIKRSEYENLLNISISHKGQYGALPAAVSGTYKNLMAQQKPLKFIEIKEKTATYYIAPVRVSGKEILHFELSVTPNGEEKPLAIKFTKTVYSD